MLHLVCLSIFNITARILWTQNSEKMIHINKYKHMYKILFSVIDFLQKSQLPETIQFSHFKFCFFVTFVYIPLKIYISK